MNLLINTHSFCLNYLFCQAQNDTIGAVMRSTVRSHLSLRKNKHTLDFFRQTEQRSRPNLSRERCRVSIKNHCAPCERPHCKNRCKLLLISEQNLQEQILPIDYRFSPFVSMIRLYSHAESFIILCPVEKSTYIKPNRGSYPSTHSKLSIIDQC